jgi:hypothetical protein
MSCVCVSSNMVNHSTWWTTRRTVWRNKKTNETIRFVLKTVTSHINTYPNPSSWHCSILCSTSDTFAHRMSHVPCFLPTLLPTLQYVGVWPDRSSASRAALSILPVPRTLKADILNVRTMGRDVVEWIIDLSLTAPGTWSVTYCPGHIVDHSWPVT